MTPDQFRTFQRDVFAFYLHASHDRQTAAGECSQCKTVAEDAADFFVPAITRAAAAGWTARDEGYTADDGDEILSRVFWELVNDARRRLRDRLALDQL